MPTNSRVLSSSGHERPGITLNLPKLRKLDLVEDPRLALPTDMIPARCSLRPSGPVFVSRTSLRCSQMGVAQFPRRQPHEGLVIQLRSQYRCAAKTASHPCLCLPHVIPPYHMISLQLHVSRYLQGLRTSWCKNAQYSGVGNQQSATCSCRARIIHPTNVPQSGLAAAFTRTDAALAAQVAVTWHATR